LLADSLSLRERILDVKSGWSECSEDSLIDLVQRIYDAALDPRLWTGFLDAFADVIRSGATSLIVHDHSSVSGHITVVTRMDPIFQRKYNEYYASVNIWKNNYEQHYRSGAIINSSALCSNQTLEKTEFYADFLRPANLYYSAGPVIYREGSVSATLSTQRSRDQQPFDREERIFRVLAPHLDRALRINRGLSEAGATREALANSPVGVMIFGLNLKLLYVNERARGILEQADGLRLKNGKIVAAAQSESRALEKLLASAVQTARGLSLAPGGYLSISQPSGARDLQLLISPVRLRFLLDPYAPAVLLMMGGGPAQPVKASSLAALFGLTKSEAALTVKLIQGRNLARAAKELGMSYGTARWHLKSIFQKTGTHRQADLVGLVLTGVASMAAETRQRGG
jgi:DNA-binding CsgD family transcriptional regulator